MGAGSTQLGHGGRDPPGPLLTVLTRTLGWTLPGQGSWDVGSAGRQLARTGMVPIVQVEREDSAASDKDDD